MSKTYVVNKNECIWVKNVRLGFWVDVRQSVLMLLLSECAILVCQKVRLGFLNVRSVRTLAAFSITQSISALCLTLTAF